MISLRNHILTADAMCVEFEEDDNLVEVRCPKCRRLLGYYEGKGELVCPRCRDLKVYFDTKLDIQKTERLERH